MDRLEEGRNVKHMTIGDIAYADDSAVLGEADEARQAEEIFALTITDFAGKINRDKTEGLRVSQDPTDPHEVAYLGEKSTVKM